MASVSTKSRQSIRDRRAQKQRKQRLNLIIGVSAVAVLLIVLVLIANFWDDFAPMAEITIPDTGSRPMAEFNAMGDPDAPVQIVVFSDYQCPVCQRFASETEPLIEENHVATGEVYLVHRSMGNFMSDNARSGKNESIDAAAAAYCAGDQGMFWQFKDTLFANWLGLDRNSYTKKRLLAMGEELGLNMDEFKSCVNNDTYRQLAEQDKADGLNSGVTGTPAYLVNGELINGFKSYSEFAEIIRSARTAAGY